MKRTMSERDPAKFAQNRTNSAFNQRPLEPQSPDSTRPGLKFDADHDEPAATDSAAATSFVALGAHLGWMLFGPVVLALLLIGMAMRPTWDLSVRDLVYFLAAAAVLALRWLDQRTGQATTGTGKRATWADFRRYAVRMPPFVLGIWLVVKLMAGFLGQQPEP